MGFPHGLRLYGRLCILCHSIDDKVMQNPRAPYSTNRTKSATPGELEWGSLLQDERLPRSHIIPLGYHSCVLNGDALPGVRP